MSLPPKADPPLEENGQALKPCVADNPPRAGIYRCHGLARGVSMDELGKNIKLMITVFYTLCDLSGVREKSTLCLSG